MSQSKATLAFNKSTKKWEISVDGVVQNTLLQESWALKTFRESAKLRKMGVKVLHVTHEDGTTSVYDPAKAAPSKRGRKAGAKKVKTPKVKLSKAEKAAQKAAAISNAPEVEVEGCEKLAGKTKTGRLISVEGNIARVQFKTKDGVAFEKSFDMKGSSDGQVRLGQEKDANPNHFWVLNPSNAKNQLALSGGKVEEVTPVQAPEAPATEGSEVAVA